MDIHPPTPDDLRAIAAEYPLRLARDLSIGIEVLAHSAAEAGKGTPHEAAIAGPVSRIFAAAMELRTLGGAGE